MVQSLIHACFFFEQKAIGDVIKGIDDSYQKLTEIVITEFKNAHRKNNEGGEEINFKKDVYINQIKELARKRQEAKNHELKIHGDIYDFKIMESFLEGAPQSVLQLVIILQNYELSNVDLFTWINIFISFASFSKTAAGIYSYHPTQVILNLIIYIYR